MDHRATWNLGRRTEIIPVKDSHHPPEQNRWLWPAASGHGRYITVTPEQTPVSVGEWPLQISDLDSFRTPGVFYTHFYNHAHRLRLEKLLYVELSRSSSGHFKFKLLLDPGGSFTSEAAARRFQN